MSKPVLCRIGFHSWVELGSMGLVVPCSVFECVRCHRREARYGYATIWNDAPEGGWTDYLELNWTQARIRAAHSNAEKLSVTAGEAKTEESSK